MAYCKTILAEHVALQTRRDRSKEQLVRVRSVFGESEFLTRLPISVFCVGSLARGEVGAKSDLDVFVTADAASTELRSRLCEYTLFAELINLNRALELPPFSNDGQYLKVNFLEDLKRQTGSPLDDSENLFTPRMLLVLESEPLLHQEIYDRHLRAVIAHYYRDQAGKRSFRPLFLLNDILRYWRTLCLNYEERRHDPSKPWRKKNVNLKFSRMVTVFSMVLPLVLQPSDSVDAVFELCRRTPLERLAAGLDELEDTSINEDWPGVLDIYEEFLRWKEDDHIEEYLEGSEHRHRVGRNAAALSTLLHRALTHERIPAELRRYLIL